MIQQELEKLRRVDATAHIKLVTAIYASSYAFPTVVMSINAKSATNAMEASRMKRENRLIVDVHGLMRNVNVEHSNAVQVFVETKRVFEYDEFFNTKPM